MSNPYRGEVTLNLNGKDEVLRLNLGALAELEAELESASLLELVERFEAGVFSASDLISLLFAGLKGAGWKGSVDDLSTGQIQGGPVNAARIAGQLLKAAFGPVE